MENLIPPRKEILNDLQNNFFDIIVIGGGATGAGIARDAVLRGLSVALMEKEDFASGTSSSSSKLLHGGLRYLKNYEFRLVREAAIERQVHTQIAPHLTEIKEFLIPLYDWNKEPGWMLRLGLILYNLLAFPNGIGRYKWLGKDGLIKKLPLLDNDHLTTGAQFNDVQTDDARLVLSIILSAVAGGAKIANYLHAMDWEKTEDGVLVHVNDVETNTQFRVRGRTLIIAGGPWTEIIEKTGKKFNNKAKLRMTRGSHVLFRKKINTYPVLIVNEDSRAVYLIPGRDYDFAGSTDVDYYDHPDDLKPSLKDTQYIVKSCNRLFPTLKYTQEDIIGVYTGLRPMVSEEGVPETDVSRDYSIFVDTDGIITVAGGKLTTYRIMAKQAVERAMKILGFSRWNRKCVTHKMPLWGGNIEDWNEFSATQSSTLVREFGIDKKSADLVVELYGSELPIFKDVLREVGVGLLIESRPWLEAQVIYACRYELVRTTIDFLRRRTTMMFEQGNGLAAVDRVSELICQEFHWNAEKRSKLNNETYTFIKSQMTLDFDKINIEL